MNSNPVQVALRRALWLALAIAPAACGAMVTPVDGSLPDGGAMCFDPSTGRTLRVGESNGRACPCVCTETGLVCANCPDQLCFTPDGRRLSVGQSVLAPDGCNTCTCQSNGSLACTELACVDGGPPDVIEPDASSCAPQVRVTVPRCESHVTYPCGIPGGPVRSGDPRCATLCAVAGTPGIAPGVCYNGPGTNTITCGVCGVGRFTEGLELDEDDARAPDTFAGWLSTGARVEAIAAAAFDRLADELECMGAPTSLVRDARASAEHEREHHRALADYARVRGVDASRSERALARGPSLARRSLEEIAVENAGEGCVRETLGAVVMAWQAEHAEDPALREVLAKIAREESAHSAWSWELDRWARSVLDPAAVARMDLARARAIAELGRAMGSTDPSPELARRAGMPPAAAVRAMIAELERSLWRRGAASCS
jgi:hypothetical protein